ncbi:MAG: YitT family protein [Bacteroidetes bacterium]|nr:YitT family protein [Bacteroidota bacterium]
MNIHFNTMIAKAVWKSIDKNQAKSVSDYQRAKAFKRFRITLRRFLLDMLFIVLGFTAAGFGLKGFLLPNNFIDGGVTGISLLTSFMTGMPLSLLIIVINAPFIYMAYKQIGRNFALKSILAITGLALAITFIPYPLITSDKLLISVFGGFFLGLGIGFSIRGGSVLDGTEVLAVYLNRKTGLTIGDTILIFNIVIFSVAAYLLNVEVALYSILTYLSASKTVDFVVEGVEEYVGVTVVSLHSDEIRQMIIEKMRRGVTIYNGKRGYGKKGEVRQETEIIYSVITRLEISKLKTEIAKIDPNAFLVMSSVKDTVGGMVKRRPLEH